MIGVDFAETFVAHAAAVGADAVGLAVGDASQLPFRDGAFDFVTAFMSLMDMTDPSAALAEMSRVVRPGGFVQFSVVHPVNNTPRRRWIDVDGERWGLAIGDYFVEDTSTDRWTFGAAPPEVQERHELFTVFSVRRTVASWLNMVAGAGLRIEEVVEPYADEQLAREHPSVADTRIVPYFLLVRARRDR
jgi:SAM-dependent methyltransferase